MNVINVVGNAIGIFVLHLGVAGVAIPSLISRAVAAVVLYIMLKNPTHTIHLTKERFHFEPEVVRRILYIGIPGGIEIPVCIGLAVAEFFIIKNFVAHEE